MDEAMKIATKHDSGADLAFRHEARTAWQRRTATADSTLRFRRVSGRAGLMSIERTWRQITAHWPAAAHYHTFDWYRIYLDALEYHENDWHFFVVYRGYTPVGIVPLRQTKTTVHGVPLCTLELPDHPHVPFADLIAPELPSGAFSAALVAYLHHCGLAWDALILRRIAADSHTRRLFAPGTMLTCHAPSPRRLLVPIPAGDAGTNAWARAQSVQFGQTEYVARRDKETLHGLLKIFLQVEASGWQAHAGLRGAIRDDSRLVRYYRRLIEVFGDGGCEIAILKLDRQPIAAQFCLLSNDARYALKTGYDPARADLGVTRLLDASMRQSAREGRCFQMMSTAPWHYSNASSRTTFDIHRFNTTRPGLSAYARMQIGQSLQPASRGYRRLRALARGRMRRGIAQVSRAMDEHLRCP